MPEETLPTRSLKTTLRVAVIFTLLFALCGQYTVAFGLSIGAALGLVSLWSLAFAIPLLFSTPHPIAKYGLMLVFFLKLPFYALVLNFAMTSKWVHPFSVFSGVALIPMVIVCKVIAAEMMKKPAPVRKSLRRELPARSTQNQGRHASDFNPTLTHSSGD